jgi:hypothetical protein
MTTALLKKCGFKKNILMLEALAISHLMTQALPDYHYLCLWRVRSLSKNKNRIIKTYQLTLPNLT